jgi:AAA+ ATPase superfamily predicted ATPase
MGIKSAWQQCQERLHRDLKAMRQQMTGQTVIHLLNEYKRFISERYLEAQLAIISQGQFRLSPSLSHIATEPNEWELLPNEQQQSIVKILHSFRTGKCRPYF